VYDLKSKSIILNHEMKENNFSFRLNEEFENVTKFLQSLTEDEF
jgi:hypothetical protein